MPRLARWKVVFAQEEKLPNSHVQSAMFPRPNARQRTTEFAVGVVSRRGSDNNIGCDVVLGCGLVGLG